jgi:hypothetical protein
MGIALTCTVALCCPALRACLPGNAACTPCPLGAYANDKGQALVRGRGFVGVRGVEQCSYCYLHAGRIDALDQGLGWVQQHAALVYPKGCGAFSYILRLLGFVFARSQQSTPLQAGGSFE